MASLSSLTRQNSPPDSASVRPPRRQLSLSSRDSTVRNQYALHGSSRVRRLSSWSSNPQLRSARSSHESLAWSDGASDSETPSTPRTDPSIDDSFDVDQSDDQVSPTKFSDRKSNNIKIVEPTSPSGTQLIEKFCCGGGCCFSKTVKSDVPFLPLPDIKFPDNDAFRSLDLKIGSLSTKTELTNITELPSVNISLESHPQSARRKHSAVLAHPPDFVQPHPPYHVFSAPVFHARELTKPGAEKRTFHFDLDVTDYPEEGDVDFKVGGAIGICPPNRFENVDEIFDILGVPKFLRDKPVLLKTNTGRWPTIWGEEQSRELDTTRRELLTWCSDLQSYPPTKALLRVLAEHTTEPNEKQILTYLVSAQGQGAFCELRTGAHITVSQLLHAFPSCKPPLPELLNVLSQLMPRFYSLSNDPHVSSSREGLAGRRLIEIAVTVHETPNWRNGPRTGVGSGFLERVAKEFIAAEAAGEKVDLRVPMFRGLMANPLSKEFVGSTGPMMLIGAGVGMAPFRGFILNRLRNANCASKIWLVQGVRDSSVDELYSGELGTYEAQIKKVVQSRRRRRLSSAHKAVSELDLSRLREIADQVASSDVVEQWKKSKSDKESHYVQDEVRLQGDILWRIINNVDGRVFVCGSTKGMGEGVEQALVDVAMEKSGMSRESAQEFWDSMKSSGRYIAETW